MSDVTRVMMTHLAQPGEVAELGRAVRVVDRGVHHLLRRARSLERAHEPQEP